ncbi:hypothetical protein T492DRAFT_1034893 [Pavlovales sp. CCMP2436]|nr:hypothetical protein T492DRAFT_1034893 [Pavlovales sp. CCMP2436]
MAVDGDRRGVGDKEAWAAELTDVEHHGRFNGMRLALVALEVHGADGGEESLECSASGRDASSFRRGSMDISERLAAIRRLAQARLIAVHGTALAICPLRAQNLLSCVQPPCLRLPSSTSLACRARRATWGATRRARWSRSRDRLDGAASPFKARGAQPSRGRRREPYRAHRAPRAPRETLDRSSVCELAAARSPAGAHAVRARREGVPVGGGGSCSARRTSKVGLGKMDERQAQVCAHTQGEHNSQVWGDDPRDCERSCA